MSGLTAWWSQHWEFVLGIVIGAVLAFLIALYFCLKTKRIKRLSWDILSKNRIIQASDAARDNFTVSYGGAEVKDPNILVIRIGNTGNEVVRGEEDFRGNDSIVVDFMPADLLLLKIVGRSDPNISDKHLQQDEHHMAYVPEYLNPGEWLDFQFITDGELQMPQMECGFAGQTHAFENVVKPPNYRARRLLLHSGLVGWSLILGLGALAFGGIKEELLLLIFGGLLIVTGVISSVILLKRINTELFQNGRPANRWKEAKPAVDKPEVAAPKPGADEDDEKPAVASVK